MSETIRLLRRDDIPGAMRLKQSAGWNQTEQDWANVIELEPEGCFALECAGALAATTTAVCYGRELAWIGMVLTAPEFRGRGFARRLMDRALEFLCARGVAWIKLDATDMGRPLYLKLGFEDAQPIERWLRLPSPMEAPKVEPLQIDAALDRAGFGAARESLLARLAAFESASLPGQGHALGRPGTNAAYFGPCVARWPEAARALLRWFLARHPEESVFWDLLPGNEEAVRLALEFGFQRRRQLVRMVRCGCPDAAPFSHDDRLIYAVAGFEYG